MKGSVKTKLDEMAYGRDQYKCVNCGKPFGLEAHHIVPDIEELSNLITLCHSCHKKQHNRAGCFNKGFDIRRKIRIPPVEGMLKGWETLRGIQQTMYYNRWLKQWVQR